MSKEYRRHKLFLDDTFLILITHRPDLTTDIHSYLKNLESDFLIPAIINRGGILFFLINFTGCGYTKGRIGIGSICLLFTITKFTITNYNTVNPKNYKITNSVSPQNYKPNVSPKLQNYKQWFQNSDRLTQVLNIT